MKKDEETYPGRGKLLISEPFLTDPYFGRSVVLLSEHNDDGTVGFILNKPTEVKLNQAVNDFPQFDVPLYFGGPVQTDVLQYIHKLGNKIEGSREIIKGIYWGGDLEILKLLMDTHQIDPSDIRFFVGYSGWDPKQLDSELKQKSWIVSGANKEITFSKSPQSLWREVLRSMGREYAIIANFPQDPSLN
jgi:putative transcriptional regulator